MRKTYLFLNYNVYFCSDKSKEFENKSNVFDRADY